MIEALQKRELLLTQQIFKLQHELSKLPEGQIVCYPNGKYSRWYLKTEHGLEWIPKKQHDFAQKLAYKKYLECRIEDLSKDCDIISSMYMQDNKKEVEPIISKTQQLLDNPHYAALLKDQFSPPQSKWSQWIREEYPTNPKHPEQKTNPTLSGINVRSKSEADIVRVLTTNHIPFRYEPALEIDNIILYPDFLIIHPKTEELYIWEHFGIMDNSEYAHHAFRKMELYNSAGFTPGERLIMTFEKKSMPFTFEQAENTVWEYLL